MSGLEDFIKNIQNLPQNAGNALGYAGGKTDELVKYLVDKYTPITRPIPENDYSRGWWGEGPAPWDATPIPTPTPTPIQQYQPDSVLAAETQTQYPELANVRDGYIGKTYDMEPNLYDALALIKDDLKRLYLSALAGQESFGGRRLEGDYNKQTGEYESFGAYHIQPSQREVTKEQAMDPKWSTQYALDELEKYLKLGLTLPQALRKWNSKSGYINEGPRYDVELPAMATTSSFLKGK